MRLLAPGDISDAAMDRAAAFLRNAQRVAVLAGAGISAESGVPTFRGAGGLWEGYRLEDVATPMAFARDPSLVWRFYNMRRAGVRAVLPNPGHQALVQLENRLDGNSFTLITQNVDGLHRLAGSKHVLELHGNLARVRCTGCGKIEDRGSEDLPDLPRCQSCNELLRPDIVWFHEMLPPDVWVQAEESAHASQCFLVIGTSAVVYPAAGLVAIARNSGSHIIEVNIERTPASELADVSLVGPSGEILPELLRRLGDYRHDEK